MHTLKTLLRKASIVMLAMLVTHAAVGETITYFHNDISGTPLGASDANGTLLWRENYKPYGDKLNQHAPSGSNKIGFHGKAYDDDTGLSYMGARYYDPMLGRFMGVDPVDFQEDNLHSFNRYAYVNNNPYKFVDPTGEYADLVIETASLALGTYSFKQNMESGNYGSAAVDAIGVAIDGVLAAVPFLPGAAGLAIQGARGLDRATDVEKALPTQGPDFVVSPNGTAFPVPTGATGPVPVVNPAGKITGSAFTNGKGGNGLDKRVTSIRMMSPTPARGKSPGYPGGYIKYENKSGQGVDPRTGRTLSNSEGHFPIQ